MDLTRKNYPMLSPTEFLLQDDALVFWVENQACIYWAISLGDLTKANPPVVRAYPSWNGSGLASPLTWEPTYSHVSDFLDTLTYHHALCGGALHGGSAWIFQREEPQRVWFDQHWQRQVIAPMVIGLAGDFEDGLPFYVRPGQALFCGGICWAASSSAEALDELGRVFQVNWKHRW